jgi:16S rRNA processing protein RimM
LSRKPAGGGRFVAIGRVLKPRGLGGEAFLHPLSDFPERFQELSESLLQKPDGNRLTLAIDHVRTYGRRMAIKFAGIDSPEAVAPLRGSELLVSAEQVYRLPDDTFYVFEIVGLKAETEAGAEIGNVKDVISHPGNDLYVISRGDGTEVLVPAARDLVRVDLAGGRLVVKNLEGLLD